MLIDSDLIIKMIPKNKEDILNSVIYYGGFLQTYENIMRFVECGESSTAILRSAPGVGKKTLLQAVKKNFKYPRVQIQDNNLQTPRKSIRGNKVDKINKQVISKKKLKFIELYATEFTDDYSAIKYIATKLKLETRPSIQDLIEDIESRKGIEHEGKIVIVLFDFEEFCTKKQSLLYSLTHLAQHGKNINLLGVTSSLDCTSGLEKRIRSRLNALFYELTLPYDTKEQYLEFASKLLGDYKITGNLKQKLEEMYIYGTRRISALKWFLVSVCSWDKKKVLIVKQPEIEPLDSLKFGTLTTSESILYNKTTSLLQLLALAVCYCCERKVPDFNLSDLHDYCLKNNIKNIDPTSPQVLNNAIILERRKLFKSTDKKANHTVGKLTKFTLEYSGPEFAAILQRNPKEFNVRFTKATLNKLLG